MNDNCKEMTANADMTMCAKIGEAVWGVIEMLADTDPVLVERLGTLVVSSVDWADKIDYGSLSEEVSMGGLADELNTDSLVERLADAVIIDYADLAEHIEYSDINVNHSTLADLIDRGELEKKLDAGEIRCAVLSEVEEARDDMDSRIKDLEERAGDERVRATLDYLEENTRWLNAEVKSLKDKGNRLKAEVDAESEKVFNIRIKHSEDHDALMAEVDRTMIANTDAIEVSAEVAFLEAEVISLRNEVDMLKESQADVPCPWYKTAGTKMKKAYDRIKASVRRS